MNYRIYINTMKGLALKRNHQSVIKVEENRGTRSVKVSKGDKTTSTACKAVITVC